MDLITREQFDEIVKVISKYCCHCSEAYCSEADCDMQDIYEILNRHIEKEDIDEEEERLPFDYVSDEEIK